jgi:ketosteroid isomerase-like protein
MAVNLLAFVLVLLFTSGVALAQGDLQPIIDAQRVLERTAAESGMRSAFLASLADDAVVFQPGPINGKDHWTSFDDDPAAFLERGVTYSDISGNGLLGYTTGNWRLYQKGKSEGLAKFGQYLTIWERKSDGQFRVSLDIAVSHEKLPFSETDTPVRRKQSREINKRGWSPADASMDFLRTSMSSERLGGAYEKFAAADVRLLRDAAPPVIGKKRVVAEMNEYVAIEFPTKVTLFQSADMAYTWNPCRFDNSNEGKVSGHCVHIWKLRKKKWWIVLGVFAPVPNETRPTIKRNTAR